ncbi:AraC-type DNA-binding protein [Cyclobacterium lianum]|uniref:AraC-type DNA-binding protein n=1 Tax=Cyclobacterium lianum TaxID=388280 RepID=A0A1M7LZE6_9BACT|nr:helix-turn-helix domain-containing protein [Cyclobacterium lianum]SHM83729.1 AraC-type DNA-binding protein [Cyclobacterium lianum]
MTAAPDSIHTKNKIEQGLILKVSKMKPVIKPTKPHRHEGYHELIYLSKGSGQHTVGDLVHEVQPPMGYYLSLGQVHCWDFSRIPEGYVVLFKEEVLTAYPKALSSLYILKETFQLPEENSSLFHLLEIFYTDYKNEVASDLLAAHLNTLILKTLHIPLPEHSIHPNVLDEFVRFKKLVQENYLHMKTAENYAEAMHVSIRKLNQICRTATGGNAIDLIRERLLIESKNLLSHTGIPVAEVAYQLNFSDASNFIKFFKSQTTLTPTEYRAKL